MKTLIITEVEFVGIRGSQSTRIARLRGEWKNEDEAISAMRHLLDEKADDLLARGLGDRAPDGLNREQAREWALEHDFAGGCQFCFKEKAIDDENEYC